MYFHSFLTKQLCFSSKWRLQRNFLSDPDYTSKKIFSKFAIFFRETKFSKNFFFFLNLLLQIVSLTFNLIIRAFKIVNIRFFNPFWYFRQSVTLITPLYTIYSDFNLCHFPNRAYSLATFTIEFIGGVNFHLCRIFDSLSYRFVFVCVLCHYHSVSGSQIRFSQQSQMIDLN